ncbi:AI-2E family transporter, partial [Methylobacterium sp. J-092]
MVIATAALFLIAEPIFGQVIEPLLYGHSTGLSPFAVIVSTLFWRFLWGPIGLILATPFTVCLVVLGRHVDSLEFLDSLLGDRPPLTTVGIVLVVVVFLLLQREDLRNRMIRLFGSSDLHRTTVAMDDAAGRLGTYFLAQLGMNAAFGVIVGVGLWFIGVPNPLLWGVFSALMRFVPYIGAFISGILPVALAAAVDPGWSMVIATAALFLIAEPIFGQVIEPLLYGHSTGLSPFAVIVSTLFW